MKGPEPPLPIDPDERRREQDRRRARRRRRREKEGLQHFNIDVPCSILYRLIDGGYLTVEDSGDRRAEEQALEAFLADQAELQ
jgi:hypothetical protein